MQRNCIYLCEATKKIFSLRRPLVLCFRVCRCSLKPLHCLILIGNERASVTRNFPSPYKELRYFSHSINYNFVFVKASGRTAFGWYICKFCYWLPHKGLAKRSFAALTFRKKECKELQHNCYDMNLLW